MQIKHEKRILVMGRFLNLKSVPFFIDLMSPPFTINVAEPEWVHQPGFLSGVGAEI